MAKIARVINSCNDCEYCKTLQEVDGNTSFSLVCNYENPEVTEEEDCFEPFMIGFYHEHPKHYANWIPKQCPLEDYKQDKEEL